MSSKKHRKKLREQYNNPRDYKPVYHDVYKLKQDREAIINYLKERQNTYVTSDELVKNCNLNYGTKTEIHHSINYIRKYDNIAISTKRGRNGGYMYHE